MEIKLLFLQKVKMLFFLEQNMVKLKILLLWEEDLIVFVLREMVN